MGTDPYGKPAWEYTFDGSIEDMADSLCTQLSLEVEQRFDRKLYETGIPMTEEEWQVHVDKMVHESARRSKNRTTTSVTRIQG